MFQYHKYVDKVHFKCRKVPENLRKAPHRAEKDYSHACSTFIATYSQFQQSLVSRLRPTTLHLEWAKLSRRAAQCLPTLASVTSITLDNMVIQDSVVEMESMPTVLTELHLIGMHPCGEFWRPYRASLRTLRISHPPLEETVSRMYPEENRGITEVIRPKILFSWTDIPNLRHWELMGVAEAKREQGVTREHKWILRSSSPAPLTPIEAQWSLVHGIRTRSPSRLESVKVLGENLNWGEPWGKIQKRTLHGLD